ncbi:hypothetical protein KI688_002947 [Linnemannia hyalina]|uniref:Cytochrome P450 n=1 Tax=Linnemannia hyalina TaxID=64524 RepID=A0A9P8BQY4_9FUNG|nr:hypothetical protein KI688_002947 [Linnemannia hyalina]
MVSHFSPDLYSEEAVIATSVLSSSSSTATMKPPADDLLSQVGHLLILLHGHILPRILLAYILIYSVFILIKYRHTSISATPRSDLPGPKGHPLIGNTIEMAQRPPGSTHQRQMGFHKQYGKVFSLTVLGLGRVIHVREPQVVDHILRVNFWAYEKGGFFRETLRPIFGDGIFSADGQHWRWQRKAASKIFNVNWYRTYTSTVFRQESQLVINYFNKITDTSLTSMAKSSAAAHESSTPTGPHVDISVPISPVTPLREDRALLDPASKVIDLQSIFYLFTLDSFGRIGFGESFGCLIDPEKEVPFAGAFDRLTANLSLRFNWPFWRLTDWWTGNDKKVAADTKIIYDFAYNIIHRRRALEEKTGVEGGGVVHDMNEGGFGEAGAKRPGVLSNSGKDLMQLFMEATDEKGERLTDESLKDTLVNFLLAGRDTTAQALSWMFYLIHRSQTSKEVLIKLREEIDTVLQGGSPTYEAVQAQKYTKACFFETLRLYPSVPQNIRCVLEDDTLPGGIKVYKGEKVTWGIWGMGRDTDIWGPDAEEFRPERWLQGDKFPSTKFVSFHLGPRTCLGQQFAYIQAITVTSMLLQKFEFELVDPHNEPVYGTSLTLPMADGLPVRITRRRDDPFSREE